MTASNIISLPSFMPESKRFIPPTLEQVLAHCVSISLPAKEGEKMWFFYSSKDWYVGKSKMKQWRSSLALWRINYMERGGTMTKTVIQAKIPSRDSVYEFGRQKGCKTDMPMKFYDYWASRNFMEFGKPIDWKIKFSESFSKSRQ